MPGGLSKVGIELGKMGGNSDAVAPKLLYPAGGMWSLDTERGGRELEERKRRKGGLASPARFGQNISTKRGETRLGLRGEGKVKGRTNGGALRIKALPMEIGGDDDTPKIKKRGEKFVLSGKKGHPREELSGCSRLRKRVFYAWAAVLRSL